MKTMFVEARKKVKLYEKKLGVLDKLPQKIGLLATIQYINILRDVKKYLEKRGKKVYVGGQILGCDISSAEKIMDKVDCLLFLGQGYFHTLQVALLGKPVFTFDESYILNKIGDREISKYKARKKSALMNVLRADKVGIIVSTKKGQYNMKEALSVKKELEKKGKEAFIFVCDTINIRELENFQCDAWLNTACPALFMEPDVLNLSDVRNSKFLNTLKT